MKQTYAYLNPAVAVPFFKSRWGLATLLAIGSGLYLYQRKGGSVSALFSKVWDLGISARDRIGQIAPSVGDKASSNAGSFSSASIQ